MNKFRRLIAQIDRYKAQYEELELQLFDTVFMLKDNKYDTDAEFRSAVERRQTDILVQMQSLLSAHAEIMLFILNNKHYG